MTGSLQESRGKYYAVLNLRDEVGNPKQKWVNLNVPVAIGNKRKAEQRLIEVLYEYERDQIIVCKKDTLFCDYILVWLEETKPKIELNTYEAYKSYIDLHILPFFKPLNLTLQSLNYQHIQRYYTLKSKTLSATSLKKHHVVINQTLKKALKHDLLANNPAEKVTLPKAEKYTGRFLSVEQGNALLAAAHNTPMETAVILAMMYGLRRSEIAGLKWNAIDFESNTLAIKHTVTKFKTVVAKDRTKNQSSTRVLPLNAQLRAYLLRLRGRQSEEKLLLGQGYQNTEYICRWPDGRTMSCDYLSRAFHRLLKRNDLPQIRLHDLRHSCASFMLKMGCSMKEISDWLGHSDIKTAMNVYAHLDIETKMKAANRLSSILSVENL